MEGRQDERVQLSTRRSGSTFELHVLDVMILWALRFVSFQDLDCSLART